MVIEIHFGAVINFQAIACTSRHHIPRSGLQSDYDHNSG